MLARCEAQLAARDRAIPGLAGVLDDERIGRWLRLQFPGEQIGSPNRCYLRYKPGQSCLVAYRLSISGHPGFIYAKAHGEDREIKLAKAELRRQGGLELAISRSQGIVLYRFPSDAKLKHLRSLIGGRGVLRSYSGEKYVRPLAYKPERRFVAAIERSGRPQAVLKVYADDVFGRARGAQAHAAAVAAEFLPTPMASDARHRALLYAWQEGYCLDQLLQRADFDLGISHRVGQMLARLHALPASTDGGLPTIPGDLAATLDILAPETAPRGRALGQRLGTATRSRTRQCCLIHGDLSPSQIVVDEGHVRLIDIDELRGGDPREDLGNFLAAVELEVLRGTLARGTADDVRRSLLDGYGAPKDRTLDHLDLFVGIGLYKLIHAPFRRGNDGWPGLISSIIARAEELSEFAMAPPPQADLRRASCAAEDPALGFLGRALDPASAARPLAWALAGTDAPSLKLNDARLLRHKPGRRALIEYQFTRRGKNHTVIGKVRAKGLDQRTFDLVTALRKAGFDDAAVDRVHTPAALGCIAEFNMWLQPKVPAKPVNFEYRERRIQEAVRAADAIFKLHQSAVATSRSHTIDDEMEILSQRLATLAAATGGRQGRRISRVLDECRRLAARLPLRPVTIIHRDYYHDQLLINGDRIWLVDLDLCSYGDPALDLGNFVAHVQELALRQYGNARALRSVEKAFTRHYQRRLGKDIDDVISIYTTLSLARHIQLSSVFSERRHLTPTLLALTESHLGIRAQRVHSLKKN